MKIRTFKKEQPSIAYSQQRPTLIPLSLLSLCTRPRPFTISIWHFSSSSKGWSSLQVADAGYCYTPLAGQHQSAFAEALIPSIFLLGVHTLYVSSDWQWENCVAPPIFWVSIIPYAIHSVLSRILVYNLPNLNFSFAGIPKHENHLHSFFIQL